MPRHDDGCLAHRWGLGGCAGGGVPPRQDANVGRRLALMYSARRCADVRHRARRVAWLPLEPRPNTPPRTTERTTEVQRGDSVGHRGARGGGTGGRRRTPSRSKHTHTTRTRRGRVVRTLVCVCGHAVPVTASPRGPRAFSPLPPLSTPALALARACETMAVTLGLGAGAGGGGEPPRGVCGERGRAFARKQGGQSGVAWRMRRRHHPSAVCAAALVRQLLCRHSRQQTARHLCARRRRKIPCRWAGQTRLSRFLRPRAGPLAPLGTQTTKHTVPDTRAKLGGGESTTEIAAGRATGRQRTSGRGESRRRHIGPPPHCGLPTPPCSLRGQDRTGDGWPGCSPLPKNRRLPEASPRPSPSGNSRPSRSGSGTVRCCRTRQERRLAPRLVRCGHVGGSPAVVVPPPACRGVAKPTFKVDKSGPPAGGNHPVRWWGEGGVATADKRKGGVGVAQRAAAAQFLLLGLIATRATAERAAAARSLSLGGLGGGRCPPRRRRSATLSGPPRRRWCRHY